MIICLILAFAFVMWLSSKVSFLTWLLITVACWAVTYMYVMYV